MTKLKYDESFPERAGEYAAKGMKNIEIAARLGISSDSFYVYLRQFPAFAEAVEDGRLAVADMADYSLMDLATGNCSVTTVKQGDSGHETRTIRRRAPDVNAVIRWLERNRQHADAGEKIADVQNSASVNMNIAANAKFDADFPAEAEIHAGNGDTDLQIARRLGISPASFYNYKRQFPEFAAALERGRRECYGRLRCQLLAIALGKCTVITETYRDGDFRKSTERQLPPNLKAIRYWLTGVANREVRSKESERARKVESEKSEKSEKLGIGKCRTDVRNVAMVNAQALSKVSESDGCPVDSADADESSSAQGLSKVSESARARKVESKKSEKSEKLGIGKCRTDVQNIAMVYAQALSKVSESERARKVESEKSEKSEKLGIGKCRTDVQNIAMVYAQALSKVSESDGGPVDSADAGEISSAQALSKVSESPVTSQSDKAAARRFSRMSRKERQRLLKNRRET
jgi:DNA-binding CsgD family transcriptional regulator